MCSSAAPKGAALVLVTQQAPGDGPLSGDDMRPGLGKSLEHLDRRIMQALLVLRALVLPEVVMHAREQPLP